MKWLNQHSPPGLAVGVLLAWLGAASCNDILGFEKGTPVPALAPTGGSAGGGGDAGSAGTGGSAGSGGAVPTEPSWAWATAIVGAEDDVINDVSVEPSGLIAAVGEFSHDLSVDGHDLATAAGDVSAFMLRLAADGSVDWAQQAGDDLNPQRALTVCHTSLSTLFVTGGYEGTMSFGSFDVTSGANPPKVFLAELSPAGDALRAHTSTTGGAHVAYAIAPTGFGGIVVGGSFITGITLVGQQAATSTAHRAGYVARLFTSSPASPWIAGVGSQPPGDAGEQHMFGAAVRPSGNVVVAGSTSAALGTAPELGHHGGTDAYVVELAADDGAQVHGLVFGGEGDEGCGRLTLDAAGNIVVTGYYTADMTIGSTFIESSGEFDLFVAKFDATGEPLWAKGFPGDGEQFGQDVITDQAGNIMVVGANNGQVDFGGGPLMSQGAFDGVVACFTPDGQHKWSLIVGGPQQDWMIAADWHEPSRSLVLGGRFTQQIELGAHTLIGRDAIDSFVAKLTVPTDGSPRARRSDPN